METIILNQRLDSHGNVSINNYFNYKIKIIRINLRTKKAFGFQKCANKF
jgi:hypothetical protein